MRPAFEQKGSSAVEFALVLPVFILVLYGLVTFGAALYTQIVVSRAAEDGARAVGMLSTASSYAALSESTKNAIKDEVIDSLANSVIAPGSNNASFATRQAWLQSNVRSRIIVDNGSCAGSATNDNVVRVRFDFPYSSTRVLPAIRIPMAGDFAAWMPSTLTGCAIVQL